MSGAGVARQGDALTNRELEILISLVDGYSTRDIAAELHLQPQTVKFHLGHIYRKLGARSRTHAVVLALRRGLVALPRADGGVIAEVGLDGVLYRGIVYPV